MSRRTCSFCAARPTTVVSDENDIMPACDKCAAAWALDPGFTNDPAAIRNLTPAPQISSEERARIFDRSPYGDQAGVELFQREPDGG